MEAGNGVGDARGRDLEIVPTGQRAAERASGHEVGILLRANDILRGIGRSDDQLTGRRGRRRGGFAEVAQSMLRRAPGEIREVDGFVVWLELLVKEVVVRLILQLVDL